jgi:hypothetical protein
MHILFLINVSSLDCDFRLNTSDLSGYIRSLILLEESTNKFCINLSNALIYELSNEKLIMDGIVIAIRFLFLIFDFFFLLYIVKNSINLSNAEEKTQTLKSTAIFPS